MAVFLNIMMGQQDINSGLGVGEPAVPQGTGGTLRRPLAAAIHEGAQYRVHPRLVSGSTPLEGCARTLRRGREPRAGHRRWLARAQRSSRGRAFVPRLPPGASDPMCLRYSSSSLSRALRRANGHEASCSPSAQRSTAMRVPSFARTSRTTSEDSRQGSSAKCRAKSEGTSSTPPPTGSRHPPRRERRPPSPRRRQE
jgi:hypothetical protein